MSELWLPIRGHEGSYEVSSLGRVRSLNRTIEFPDGRKRFAQGQILKARANRGTHLYVNLGKGNSRYVHQLVAEAFLGPCPKGAEVRHGTGGSLDNRPNNLEYGTHAENMADVMRDRTHWRHGQTHCIRNHEFTPENTGKRKSGRVCLACKRDRKRKVEP